jgi:lauroyl/myristoyl acyltransferase
METEPFEFVAALVAAKRMVEPCPLPSADLRLRLATAPWLRRVVPTRLAVRHAERRGRELWEASREERARARAAMEAIVGGTPRAQEVEQLAREHLVEGKVRETLFWQPWKPPSLDARSAARLRDACGCGRGVLISPCHVGPYLLCVSAIAELGRTPYSAAGPWLFQPPTRGLWGRRIARRRSQARARGERLICSARSFPVLAALLSEGEIVSVFFVVPGHRETRFLGKTVMLASGSARLAMQTNALVVPVRARRVGHRVRLDVDEPLDPGAFTSAEVLHEALAARHERWMFDLPATSEDPNRDGAWEQRATVEGWIRPSG